MTDDAPNTGLTAERERIVIARAICGDAHLTCSYPSCTCRATREQTERVLAALAPPSRAEAEEVETLAEIAEAAMSWGALHYDDNEPMRWKQAAASFAHKIRAATAQPPEADTAELVAALRAIQGKLAGVANHRVNGEVAGAMVACGELARAALA